MNISLKIYMGIIILVLSPFLVQGQFTDPVTFTVSDAPTQVKAGEVFNLTVKAKIDGEWHLYSVNNDPDAGPFPTKFTLSNEQVVFAGNIKESDPIVEYDPNFGVELGWHTQEAVFTIPLAISKELTGNAKIA